MLNPFAGGGRAAKLEEAIRTRIRTDHPGARFVVAGTIPEAHALIEDTRPDARIVLIGGDGTINRMLPPLVRTTRELGIVPLGSGNDVARALNDPANESCKSGDPAFAHAGFELIATPGAALEAAVKGMEALARNGFRYPFPQYGIQQDVREGMAASYPAR